MAIFDDESDDDESDGSNEMFGVYKEIETRFSGNRVIAN